MSNYQVVIGLETHVQLNTNAKLFSSSPATYSANPNSQANELDFGLPGVLPVVNKEAINKAIKFGLAINAKVNNLSEFARKHYFYPDLPKGYQTSQFEHPIIEGGKVEVASADGNFSVDLVRAHLEEDAGKLMHDVLTEDSVVDLNRAGVPLLEIVSEPVMYSASAARDYARALRELVCWLDICDGNMQEGSIRFDVNISLRKSANDPLGTRTETKNLNSFRFMEQAIHFEVARQSAILDDGREVIQETRLFDPIKGETRSMRSKEEAQDYRYMPCPDLLPLNISNEWIKSCQDEMPELPADCRTRLVNDLGISNYDAGVLTADKNTVNYFEAVVNECNNAKIAANWITGDLAALCKEHEVEVSNSPISAKHLANLIKAILDETISGKMAKDILVKMWESKEDPTVIIEREGLKQISNTDELEAIIKEVIANNPNQVEQFKAGKDKLLGFFVGQTMKATKGQGNPKQINELVRKLLK